MKSQTLLITIFSVILSSFSPSAQAAEPKIRLSGSSTIAPLMSEIAERYEKKNNVRIDIQTGGSSRGIADAKRGLSELGMSSRALYEKEKINLTTYTVARDGVVFVLHKSNPVNSLSSAQLTHIFNGTINNWKELGGEDAPIVVVNRAKGRSEHDLVSKFLNIAPAKFYADSVAGENQQCVKIVASNKNAISYLSIGTALFEINNGTALKASKLDGIEASFENVKNERFPIVRPLILISQEVIDESTKSFLDFTLSSDVHDLIRELSFVPNN